MSAAERPEGMPPEQRIAAGRAAVSAAKQALDRAKARAPSRPDIPAVLDPLPALVTTLRAAGVPMVHAALRDWLRGLSRQERDMALALLAELPAIVAPRKEAGR